jgi:hypothetical protein
MLTKSRLAVVTALAVAALGAPPAIAMPSEPAGTDPRQQDMHASTVEVAGGQQDSSTQDARGEHAAALAERSAGSDGARVDLRGDAAREPFVQPVVVEVDEPASVGFDWQAAIIGLGAGLALAVLAGVGVAGGRRRQAGARTV